MTVTAPLIRVLFVDDEPFVLDAIRRGVRNKFDAVFAEGGQAALDLLRSADTEPFGVVCCDMRMPGIDGLAVLTAFKLEAPDTTRILLTGQTELEAAIAAVNVGSVFRFLTKPTQPDDMFVALNEAGELNRLHRAERELLEQTLRGSIGALLETLSLANPTAFARAQRLRTYVLAFLEHLEIPDPWEVEVAVMLSQLGAVTLPPAVSERLNAGGPLSRADEEMIAALPGIAVRLLADIPRLDGVRSAIAALEQGPSVDAPIATRLVQLASLLDTLTSRQLGKDVIMASVDERASRFGNDVIAAFTAYFAKAPVAAAIELIPIGELQIGAHLAGDIRTHDGLLLVARGQLVSESLLLRVNNFEQSSGLADSTVAVFSLVPDRS